MSFFREIKLDENGSPFAVYREAIGFIPNLLRAQSLLPRIIEAQAILEKAVLFVDGALSRVQKEQIVLLAAASLGDAYSVTMRGKILNSLGMPDAQIDQLLTDYRQAGLPADEVAMMDFCLRLSHYAPWVKSEDIDRLRACGFEEGAIMEAVLATGYASYLCAMSAGLGPKPDFEPRKQRPIQVSPPLLASTSRGLSGGQHGRAGKQSYLHSVYRSPKTFEPFILIQKSHGFIPNFFRAQTARPDLIEAEAKAIVGVLLPEDILSRKHKEYLLLVVSAANLNSYCVAVHCNLLRGLGLTPEEGDQIAVDYREANLSEADTALLDFALKVGVRTSEFRREDISRLRTLGFTEEQILECVAVTALNNFANTVQMGLGIEPDFEPPQAFERKKVHLIPGEARPTGNGAAGSLAAMAADDPDASLVAEAQGGGLEAFETLVRRHSRTVYRTLMAILGDPEGAQDAMQDVFLSAFKNVGRFQGRSKFSTWLVSIARNTALQRLRDHKNFESLDDGLSEGLDELEERIISHYDVGYGTLTNSRQNEEVQAMRQAATAEEIRRKAGGPLEFPAAFILRPSVHGIFSVEPLPIQSFLETLSQEELRTMWQRAFTGGPPCRRGPQQQSARESGNPLRDLPHVIALAKRQTARSLVLRLRETFDWLGIVRDTPNTAQEIWESLSQAEKYWASFATLLGPFHSEWPDVPRVAKRITSRVDRLRGLGNAIIPQIAEWIGKRIIEAER